MNRIVLQGKAVALAHGCEPDMLLYSRADFSQRGFALVLDLFFMLPAEQLCRVLLARPVALLEATGLPREASLLRFGPELALVLAFLVIPTWHTGQTLGKSIVGLRVATRDYEARVPLWRVAVRETLGKGISFLLLGIGFLMAKSTKRIALHDALSGTQVLVVKEALQGDDELNPL